MEIQRFKEFNEAKGNTQKTAEVSGSAVSSFPSGNLPDAPSATTPWGEWIRRSQNGDLDATLTLLRQFEPLLEQEAHRLMRQGLCPEYQDAKSEIVLLFLELINIFPKTVTDDARIPGLIKTYLHNERMDMAEKAKRHNPESFAVDFEQEMEENSPFSRFFPRCEILEDEELYRAFQKRALRKAISKLKEKEIYIVKKYFLENKPPTLIAEELHCSTRYVRKVRQKALEKIRRYLETHYPEFRAL